ncbi:hypothetical protein EVA_08094, partial [gut metagenome]
LGMIGHDIDATSLLVFLQAAVSFAIF